MIGLLTVISVMASGGLYLALSWRMHKRSKRLDDLLPLTNSDSQAHVLSSREFSAATVAPTISLATVILAFTELAPYLGLWLLWTVATTAAGIFVARITAPIIWRRISSLKVHRPTLHEFLGHTFNSDILTRSAALCTSLGFLGALAVELTVGSHFLAALVPGFPIWLAVIVLASIGITYTALGGFRAVVVTDRIQMWAIWAAIIGLMAAITWTIAGQGGVSTIAKDMPIDIYNFSWREGLTAFLVGIFIINVPTFIADMSIWQRIAASKDERIVTRGLLSSIFSSAVSWSSLVIIACLLVAIVPSNQGENLLFLFLRNFGALGNFASAVIFLIIVAGLYAASLSTASTQLIVTTHTLHTDILRIKHDRIRLANAAGELAISRAILVGGAVVAVALVEVLTAAGFSIADLVFAVYGAQLGLVPAVLSALFLKKEMLSRLGTWCSAAVLAGFLAGWATAAYGKFIDNADITFLAPLGSLAVSSIILSVGLLNSRWHRKFIG